MTTMIAKQSQLTHSNSHTHLPPISALSEDLSFSLELTPSTSTSTSTSTSMSTTMSTSTIPTKSAVSATTTMIASTKQSLTDSNTTRDLPSISALSEDLSCSLFISGISRTGPPGAVYHDSCSMGCDDSYSYSSVSCMGLSFSRAALEEALGGNEAIEALHRDSTESDCNDNYNDDYNDDYNNECNIRSRDNATVITNSTTSTTKNHAVTSSSNSSISTNSLVQRSRVRFQNELRVFKERTFDTKSSQEPTQTTLQHHKQQFVNAAA